MVHNENYILIPSTKNTIMIKMGGVQNYYQSIAINRTVEVIAKVQNRILLVMVAGTGKTYTALQIIFRL